VRVVALAVLALACEPGSRDRSAAAEATFWYSYGGRNREVLEDLVRRFNRANGRVGRIRGTFQGDYFEALAKLRAALVGRRAPALTHVVAEAVPSLAEAGVLEDLGRFARGPEGLEVSDLVPALSQEGTFSSGPTALYAIPFNRSTPILYFNRRLLGEAGIRPPATWDELRSAARALTRREEDRTARFGLTCPLSWWFWYAALHQAGGTLLSPDGRRAAFAGPAGVAALRLYVDLAKEGALRLPPGRDFAAWESAHADFLGERAAMLVTSTAFLSYLTDNAHFEIGAAPLPAGVVRAAPTGGTFFVIPKSAPAQEKRIAWAFVRWMTDPAQTSEWSRRTGYLPVRRSAVDSSAMQALYRERPNFRVALDQLDRPARFPWSPALLAIEREIVQPAIERVATGRERPEVALARAARAADARLAEYR
jgi:sn-glycerol 3-phosphate transport system substrate-binding protein